MKKIYLVDVSSLFFRAFYAIRQLNNSKGLPTNALYGFVAAVVKILKEQKPDGMAFCFDRPESGFREELFPDYKANRDEAPSDLVKQIPYLPLLAEAMSVPAFEQPGFEADDIIGTLTKKSLRQGIEVTIVSGDKDFGQLVAPGVQIFDPAKDVFIDKEGVRAKFGIDPDQVVDYLALVGDASDNVPGVRGIGPKGAVKLLQEFKTLDGIYKSIDQVKNDRLRELLTTQKDQAYMSQKLCTIHTDIDIDVDPKDLNLRPIKKEKLVPLFEELNFKSFMTRLLGNESSDVTPAPTEEKLSVILPEAAVIENLKTLVAQSVSQVQDLIEDPQVSEIWFDITPRGVGLQVSDTLIRYEGDTHELTSYLNQTLDKRKLKISGFDVKTIVGELKISPEFFQEIGTDVLLQAYCTGKEDDFDLENLIKAKLGAALPDFASPEDRLKALRRLSRIFDRELQAGRTLSVLQEIDQPLSPVLFQMERFGITINDQKLEDLSKGLFREGQLLESEIHKLAGYPFNIGSPKQLGQVLFEKLKLPAVRKTKTGYSTDSDVLEKLKSQHPICEKILEWREVSKLKSTYVDTLPKLMDLNTGRVHTHYSQAGTTTGRLSSYQPNLQNIPIRSSRGQKIREAFIAAPGSVLISADYSQVELRILAHLTGDPGLKAAFEKDVDIHTATAAEVFGVGLGEVTPDQRRASKAINFGIAYGMSDFGLAESLSVDRRVAADYIAAYFKRYPGVQQYMHDVVENGKKNLYVETLFGRRRYYSGLRSSNGRIRQNSERAAINMPIQGAAADLIKMAMIKAHKSLRDQGFPAKMLLQVHDELVFEAPEEQGPEVLKKVTEWMENAYPLSVPLRISIGSGKDWGSAH